VSCGDGTGRTEKKRKKKELDENGSFFFFFIITIILFFLCFLFIFIISRLWMDAICGRCGAGSIDLSE
jgi:hypothetical protein